jgi:Ca2+-binding EF-hand superfamily protein
MGGGFGAQAFARMDMDRDGRVSLAEATRARVELFERMDRNDDGRISPEERQAVRAERQGR